MNPFEQSDPRWALWNAMNGGASAPSPVGALTITKPPEPDPAMAAGAFGMPIDNGPSGGAVQPGGALSRIGTSLASGHAAEDWADYSGNHGLSAVGALASVPDAVVNYGKFANAVQSGAYNGDGDNAGPFNWNAAARDGAPAAANVVGALGLGGAARAATTGAAGEVGVFGGRGALAQTPRDAAILKASEDSLTAGYHPESVRKLGGWYEGADGQMRKEIPDAGSTLKPSALTPGFTGKVSDIFDHPDLYSAYPGAKDVKYTTDPSLHPALKDYSGAFLPDRNGGPGTIFVNPAMADATSARGTILHELQHYVQGQEGFNPGADPGGLTKMLGSAEDGTAAYMRNMGETEARNVEKRMDFTPEQMRARSPISTADYAPWEQHPYTGDEAYSTPQGALSAKFNKADQDAFRNYSGAHFDYVNRMLRNGPEDVAKNYIFGNDKIGMRQSQKTMDGLATAFAKPDAVTAADQTVYRGFRGEQGQKIPAVGDVVNDPGYMSTSTRKGVAQGYMDDTGHMVELTVPAGKRGVTLGDMSHETTSGEILLDKGSRYRVDAVDGKNVKATLLAGGSPVGALAAQPAPANAPNAPNGPNAPDLATYRVVPKDEADRLTAKMQAGGKLSNAERNAAVAYAFQNNQALPKDMAMRPEMTPSVQLRAAMNDPSSLPPPVPALGSAPAKRDATPEQAKDGGTVSSGRQPPKGAMVPQGDAAELAASQRGDTAAVLKAQAAQNAPLPGRPPLTVTGKPPQAGSDGAMFQGLETKYGLPAGYLGKIGAIESSNGKNMSTPLSSAKGYFQFIDSTAKAYGVDVNSTASSADGAARLAVDNRNALAKGLGVDPSQITGEQLYLAHQQGAGNAIKILKNPDASMESLVGEKAAKANGGSGLTGGQFASKWGSSYTRAVMGGGRGLPNKSAPLNQGPGSGGVKGAMAPAVTPPAPQLAARPGVNGQDGEDAPASKGSALGALAGSGGRGRSNPVQFGPAEQDHQADLSLSALIKRRGKPVKGALAR